MPRTRALGGGRTHLPSGSTPPPKVRVVDPTTAAFSTILGKRGADILTFFLENEHLLPIPPGPCCGGGVLGGGTDQDSKRTRIPHFFYRKPHFSTKYLQKFDLKIWQFSVFHGGGEGRVKKSKIIKCSKSMKKLKVLHVQTLHMEGNRVVMPS